MDMEVPLDASAWTVIAPPSQRQVPREPQVQRPTGSDHFIPGTGWWLEANSRTDAPGLTRLVSRSDSERVLSIQSVRHRPLLAKA